MRLNIQIQQYYKLKYMDTVDNIIAINDKIQNIENEIG